jgi:hypothetical protein
LIASGKKQIFVSIKQAMQLMTNLNVCNLQINSFDVLVRQSENPAIYNYLQPVKAHLSVGRDYFKIIGERRLQKRGK